MDFLLLCEPLDLVGFELIYHEPMYILVDIWDESDEVFVHGDAESLLVGLWWDDGGISLIHKLFYIALNDLVQSILLDVVNDAYSHCLGNWVDDDQHGVINDGVLGQVKTIIRDCNFQKSLHHELHWDWPGLSIKQEVVVKGYLALSRILHVPIHPGTF